MENGVLEAISCFVHTNFPWERLLIPSHVYIHLFAYFINCIKSSSKTRQYWYFVESCEKLLPPELFQFTQS